MLSGRLISIAGLSGWLLPLALSPLIDTNSEFFFGTGGRERWILCRTTQSVSAKTG